MRICAVSPFPPTVSGVADYGALLVEGLARDPRVDHVTVLADRAPAVPDRERNGRMEVRRVWTPGRANIGASLIRAIASTRADVVWFNLGLTMFGTHPFGAASGLAAPLAARISRRRTVVTIHELPALADLPSLGFARARDRAVGAAALGLVLGANEIVVTLERYRDHLARRHGVRRVRHIPHGLWAPPERLPEPPGDTLLVFGTFGPHKDPGLVAQAVARLRRARPGLRLLVAGRDHPRHPGFMAACRARYALDGAWLGYVPREDLASLFARATIVVVPSLASTGASGVIHRAIGHGRAVVVSDLPDFRALADEEGLRFEWFASGDVAALAGAIDALLGDPARRAATVAHNLRSVARLAPSHTVDAYLDLFIGHRRAAPAASRTIAPTLLEPRVEA